MEFDYLDTSPVSEEPVEEPTEHTEATELIEEITEPVEEPTEETEAIVEVIDYTPYLEEINKNISDIMALNLVLVLITIFTFMSRFFRLNRRDW